MMGVVEDEVTRCLSQETGFRVCATMTILWRKPVSRVNSQDRKAIPPSTTDPRAGTSTIIILSFILSYLTRAVKSYTAP